MLNYHKWGMVSKKNHHFKVLQPKKYVTNLRYKIKNYVLTYANNEGLYT